MSYDDLGYDFREDLLPSVSPSWFSLSAHLHYCSSEFSPCLIVSARKWCEDLSVIFCAITRFTICIENHRVEANDALKLIYGPTQRMWTSKVYNVETTTLTVASCDMTEVIQIICGIRAPVTIWRVRNSHQTGITDHLHKTAERYPR